MGELEQVVKLWLSDVRWFSQLVVRRRLRRYQLEPARAILQSVLFGRGLEFAVLFPRQAGKSEMAAQTIAYLLNLFQHRRGASIIHAAPTFHPQAEAARRRLEAVLGNEWNRGAWKRSDGGLVQLGQATAQFLSADPAANVVGATANVLLVCDEAQHILESVFFERFAPMTASTNATVAYLGTAWTSRTLLARTIEQLRAQEKADGVRRVFVVTPDQVAEENAAYGDHVRRQVARLGRTHPLIKTQYYNEAIDAEGGMFPPARQALMRGTHPRQLGPSGAGVYALLLDVAGEDEGAGGGETATGEALGLHNPGRDSTALTVVEVDLGTLADPVVRAPTYRVMDRREWLGVKHTQLYGEVLALAEHWRARYLVADATGVGAGLVAFLRRALGEGRVLPFEFNAASKSELGWAFLAVCDTGRFKDYAGGERAAAGAERARFWRQVEFCQYDIRPGPVKAMRWGVPDGMRDPATGELVHDDLLLSAALCAVLDNVAWAAASPTLLVPAADPLAGRERAY